MKIDINKDYTFREGEPVRILCTDNTHPVWKVVGVDCHGCVHRWTSNGRWCAGRQSYNDLMESNKSPEVQAVILIDGEPWDAILTKRG